MPSYLLCWHNRLIHIGGICTQCSCKATFPWITGKNHTVVCTKLDLRMRKMKGSVLLFVVALAIAAYHGTNGQGMAHVCMLV